MDELIARMAGTPSALAHMVAEANDEQLDDAAPGAWSARTILAHFRDDEFLCMRVVLERALAEDTPTVRFIEGRLEPHATGAGRKDAAGYFASSPGDPRYPAMLLPEV